MQDISHALKYIFRWPSIAFWLSIIAGVSGLFAGDVLYIIRMKRFPSVMEITTNISSATVFKIFVTIAAPFLGVVCYRTTLFMQKTIKISPSKNSSNVSLMMYGHIASSVLLPLSYFLFVYMKSLFLCMIFFVSLFAFHLTIDLIYAICTGSMIRIAWITNLCIGGSFGSIIVFRFLALITGWGFLTQLSNIAMTATISIAFFKIIFTGIIVLGARFIDTTVDMFKKEKQTIIDESYGMA